jgi:hypothetical protein
MLGFRKVFKQTDLSLRKIVSLFIVFALFGIFYRVTDQFTFFIASYVFWAMLMGIGSHYAFELIRWETFSSRSFLDYCCSRRPFSTLPYRAWQRELD